MSRLGKRFFSRSLVTKVAIRMVVSMVFLMWKPEVALSDDYDSEGPAFKVGESCAALAYVDDAQLKDLLAPYLRNGFDAFCFPEEPFLCDDYSSFLGTMGEMVVGSDGYMCRFLPEAQP